MSGNTVARLSRREMLRLAGLGALGALAASCAPSATPETVVVKETVVVQEEVVVKETVMVPQAGPAEGEVLLGCPSWWLSMLPWVYEATDRW